jgi:hypothetical protein
VRVEESGEAVSDGLSSQVRIRLLFRLKRKKFYGVALEIVLYWRSFLRKRVRGGRSNSVQPQGRCFLVVSVTATKWRHRLPSPLLSFAFRLAKQSIGSKERRISFYVAAVLPS